MKYLNLANLFTFASLASGFLAVIFVTQQYVFYAALLWLLAVLLDWLDGRIARKLKVAGEFGMYLDSLADVGVFGFAPALGAVLLAGPDRALIICAFLFLAAGTFRLARFQAERREDGFTGMPITVNGLTFPLLLIVSSPAHYVLIFSAYFLVSGALMVATFKVGKL